MGLISWLKSRISKNRPETEAEEYDEDAYSIEPGTRYTMKLSEFLKVFNLNEVSVIYSRNEDGTYTFVIGYAFKIPSSYDNPTEQDLKDMEYGAAFRFVCAPEVMDVNEIYDMDNLDGYVRDNFRKLDIGQFIWDNGYYKTILFGLWCTQHGEFIEFNIGGEIYYVKDFDLDAVCIPAKEFRAVYKKVFPNVECQTSENHLPRLGIDSGRMKMQLSEFFSWFDFHNDIQIIYGKNPDGTFTFYAAYVWNIPTSYDNPTEDDLKYCENGMVVKTTGNLDIMDIKDLWNIENFAGYVRDNFRAIDLGQLADKDGLGQIFLDSVFHEVCGEFIKVGFGSDEYVCIKDCVLEFEAVTDEEYDRIYEAAFKE